MVMFLNLYKVICTDSVQLLKDSAAAAVFIVRAVPFFAVKGSILGQSKGCIQQECVAVAVFVCLGRVCAL